MISTQTISSDTRTRESEPLDLSGDDNEDYNLTITMGKLNTGPGISTKNTALGPDNTPSALIKNLSQKLMITLLKI